ncbi:hypothetical protein Tco_1524656 [Tanacetum coccineum]
MDKGSKERSPPHNLGRNRVNTYAVRITMLIADIEDDIMDPVMQCTTLPSHSGFSQKKLVSFVTEIHTTSIDFLIPIHKLLTRVLRIILVILPEHPSDTYVLTMKMEILLEPASNKLLVEDPTLELKPCQGDSLNLLITGTDIEYLYIKENVMPHSIWIEFITTMLMPQTTKTYYKHQDSRSLKLQELKNKDLPHKLRYTRSSFKDIQVLSRRLYKLFKDDAKYEHVLVKTQIQQSWGGQRRSRQKDKDLKISDEKDKVKRQ